MIYLFSADRTTYHEISHVESFQATDYYNGIGSFTLSLGVDQYNLGNIEPDAILYRSDTGQTYVVERIAIDASVNKITLNGYTPNRLLNRRVFTVPVAVATVQADLYTGITANLRSLPGVAVTPATPTLTETASAILAGTEIADTVITLLDAVELGHRMHFSTTTAVHSFEIYKGVDRTAGSQAVIFSDERGTAPGLLLENDSSTLKNKAYVVGELADETLIAVTVGSPAAAREVWLDSRLRQEDGETEAALQARLQTYGAEELAKRIQRLSFSVAPPPAEFRTLYNLGDKVTCVSKRFDVQFSARIQCAKYTIDAKGERTVLTLGAPQLDVIGELKLWR